MPSKDDDSNVKTRIPISGAKKTLSENSHSPYKNIEIESIEDEINELKSIKTRLQQDMRDQKWEKIPKIFKYAAELHNNEALGLHQQILKLKSENQKLK